MQFLSFHCTCIVTHSETHTRACKHIQYVNKQTCTLQSHLHHNCCLNKLMSCPKGSGRNNCDISLKAPLEHKVMNTFSMEPAFCAVKLAFSEMNKMGF